MSRKVAVVTSGASGIGLAVVRRFLAANAIVIAADLNALDDGDADGARFQHIDVTDPGSVRQGVDRIVSDFGRIDGLVHSAGIAAERPFLDTGVEEFDRILAVNLRGTFLVNQAVAGVMKEAGGGSIVNMSSISGLTGNSNRSAYGASKGGVVTLSKVIAVELAPFGIRVNVIAPGPIDTPLVAAIYSQETRRQWDSRVPLRRFGRPEEVADAAMYLCSDTASYVTGHVLTIDGGFSSAGIFLGGGSGPDS